MPQNEVSFTTITEGVLTICTYTELAPFAYEDSGQIVEIEWVIGYTYFQVGLRSNMGFALNEGWKPVALQLFGG